MAEQAQWQESPVYVNLRMPDSTVFRYVHEGHVADVDEVCEDGASVDVVVAVTAEAVRATRFMQVWESMDRTDAEFEALVELGLLIEDKDNRRGDAVRFYENAPDATVILAALQQSGAGHGAARWLVKWYGDILRLVPHPLGWACDNCMAAGACAKKYCETDVATTVDECDGVVLAAAYAAVGEPPPGPDAEALLDALEDAPFLRRVTILGDSGERDDGSGLPVATEVGHRWEALDLKSDTLRDLARTLLAGQTTAPEAEGGDAPCE